MSKRNDVIIVGAGVIGCSIAYHLAKKGISSQIIERESVAARASGKAWAVIPYPPIMLCTERAPGSLFTMPEGETLANWIDLYWSGYHRMADIALDIREQGGVDIEFGETPWTLLATSEGAEAGFKQLLSYMRDSGYYECEWLGSEDLKAVFPGINPEVRGGLSVPFLQLEPYKYTLGLAQAAEAMGARIQHGEVAGFSTKGTRITTVKLASGAEVEADVVVITMGPWSGQGTSWLGKEIPILLNMEQCLRVEAPKGFPLHMITDGDFSIIPKINGDVILGRSGHADIKDDFNDSLSEDVKKQIMEATIDMISDLEEAKLIEHRGDLEGWAPAPAYNKPVLGRLPEWENAFIAARFGTLGMTQSAGTGKYMAALIAQGGRSPYHAKSMMKHLSPAQL